MEKPSASGKLCLCITNKIKKCEFMHNIRGKLLTHVNQRIGTYLVVMITSHLKRSKHISNVCFDTRCELAFLNQKLGSSACELRLQAYRLLAKPSTQPYAATDKNELEKVEFLAAQFICSFFRCRVLYPRCSPWLR